MLIKDMASHIEHVAIFGGTHGNETNGVYVIDGFKRDPRALARPSFSAPVSLFTTNPTAVDLLTRFRDQDLNRQFRYSMLADETLTYHEAQRAKHLNYMLGPKPASYEDPDTPPACAVDFCIDLHTTTSNMGCTIIVPCNDLLSLRAAVYTKKCLEANHENTFPIKVYLLNLARPEAPYIATAAKHGVMIECGPTPWGVVRYDIVKMMRESIAHLLDYVDQAVNAGRPLDPPMPTGAAPFGTEAVVNMCVFDSKTQLPGKIPAPATVEGKPLAMFHPDLQDNDWKIMKKGDAMFVHFDGSIDTYDGRFGDEVQVHFVNEAAYYLKSSGLGFEVSIERTVSLTTSNKDMK